MAMAIGRALSAYSVNLLILCCVVAYDESNDRTFCCKTL
uniref:Uncharacterized protein n=1 Tax=Setaria viridis TaxID=4556 RepID=A0A4U6VAG8_SETVI|nr:hypothetical protein SEVIR_3G120250v2 [Setaria viridis]TKW25445.1 hypothetical protein SEVIR_3G120250v2 [Setaria viridis]TKW25446.1 hypothetical protein SEVIR_3G120250v2 [Setaria viridis]